MWVRQKWNFECEPSAHTGKTPGGLGGISWKTLKEVTVYENQDVVQGVVSGGVWFRRPTFMEVK